MTTIADISSMDAAELRGVAAKLIHENAKLREDNKNLAERKSKKVLYSQFLYIRTPTGWGYGTQIGDEPWKKILELHYPFRNEYYKVDATRCMSPADISDLLTAKEQEIDRLQARITKANDDLKLSEDMRMRIIEEKENGIQ